MFSRCALLRPHNRDYVFVMHVRLLGIFALFSAACGFPATAAAPPPLTPAATSSATARWPGVTPASLSTGHDVFLGKCNGCHGYPDLRTIADDQWPPIVQAMAKKSGLSAAESDDVLHFILASRSPQKTTP